MSKISKQRLAALESIINPSQAAEYTMLKWLIREAQIFYSEPENRKAFEDWKMERSQKPPEHPESKQKE